MRAWWQNIKIFLCIHSFVGFRERVLTFSLFCFLMYLQDVLQERRQPPSYGSTAERTRSSTYSSQLNLAAENPPQLFREPPRQSAAPQYGARVYKTMWVVLVVHYVVYCKHVYVVSCLGQETIHVLCLRKIDPRARIRLDSWS